MDTFADLILVHNFAVEDKGNNSRALSFHNLGYFTSAPHGMKTVMVVDWSW